MINSTIIFPGAGYIEAARAASSAVLATESAQLLQQVFFVSPLVLEADSHLWLACEVGAAGFNARSGGRDSQDEVTHCTGRITLAADDVPILDVPHRRVSPVAVPVDSLYDHFDSIGLQYGPTFRALDVIHSKVKSDHAFAQQIEGRFHARESTLLIWMLRFS